MPIKRDKNGVLPDLVGRDEEIAQIRQTAKAAAVGRGRMIVVRGEPGIGKTAILNAIEAETVPLFPRVLRGGAQEIERRVPFGAIATCLWPAVVAGDGDVEKIFDLMRTAGGREDAQYAVIESVLALIEDWSAFEPVMLMLDDLQWADPASLLLIHRLGRTIEQSPLLLVTACRTGALSEEVELLLRSPLAKASLQIDLGPLSDPAVDSLLADTLGAQPGPVLRRMVADAGGNPLYVIELAGGLAREQGLQDLGDATVEVGDVHRGPATLAAAIASRLDSLTPRTRQTLRVAALLGSCFSAADLSAALAEPASELLGPIDEALNAGVVAPHQDRLEFRHVLIRNALEAEMPASARSALHLQIAQALVAAGAPPAQIAGHLQAAGPTETAYAAWLADLAGPLAASSPEVAADVLGLAVTTAQFENRVPDPRIFAGLTQSLLRTGSPERAEAVARSALSTVGRSGGESDLRWALALSCLGQGRTDRAIDEIEAALSTGRLTRSDEARFQGLAAQCYMATANEAKSTNALRQGLAAADDTSDTQALANVLAAAALAGIWEGRIEDALSYSDASISATETLGPLAGPRLAPHIPRGVSLMELHRPVEAEQALNAALQLAERGTGTEGLAWCYQVTARLHYLQGRWDEALATVQTGVELSDEFQMTRQIESYAGLIAVHRGDRAALAQMIPVLEGIPPVSPPGSYPWHGPAWACAMAAWAEGQIEEAFALLRTAWPADEDVCQARYMRHYMIPDLLALGTAVGEHAEVERIASSFEKYAVEHSTPAVRLSIRFARGIADNDPAAMLDVADDYAQAGIVLSAAQAREYAAPGLAKAGDTAAAQQALTAALATYESLEATWDRARAEAQLRALGVRRGVRGPRRRPKYGWEALTETERVVASLVAEGQSNPKIGEQMYLSRRTVQGHVSSILTKLGLHSRVELATAVVQQTRSDLGSGSTLRQR